MRSLELFAGAGGLAMGVARAGFEHVGVYEWNRDAVATIRRNQERGVKVVSSWPVHEADVSKVDFKVHCGKLDLLSGGPPCQPFSLGGKHRGHKDIRNLFPETFRALHESQPRAFVIENVKGLLRKKFAPYFEYILLQLAYPEILPKKPEEWREHLPTLEKAHTSGASKGLQYKVIFRLLNAANFGVPQKRERVVMVGVRADLGCEWSFPEETHSVDALLYEQWVTGEYWDRHRVEKRSRPEQSPKLLGRIARLKRCGPPCKAAWKTVRDALQGLPDPEEVFMKKNHVLNHEFNPGARSYPGHTGSPLDEPAKTLKAGDHGVPGGENMLRYSNGKVRYFTVRESARLQTFPDEYDLAGTWSEAMRQLGNAVPVKLAEVVACSVRKTLAETRG